MFAIGKRLLGKDIKGIQLLFFENLFLCVFLPAYIRAFHVYLVSVEARRGGQIN